MDTFTDANFAPAEVTERPQQSDNEDKNVIDHPDPVQSPNPPPIKPLNLVLAVHGNQPNQSQDENERAINNLQLIKTSNQSFSGIEILKTPNMPSTSGISALSRSILVSSEDTISVPKCVERQTSIKKADI